MDAFAEHLAWIDSQHDRMVSLTRQWASINSHTANLVGLARMCDELASAFGCLQQPIKRVKPAPFETIDDTGAAIARSAGDIINIRRPVAGRKSVLLCIHMDTVYPMDSPFQRVEMLDSHTMHGPGVADAKGGLAVMMIAIEALMRSPWRDQLGWEVLINSDEEIGSPASLPTLHEAAKRNDLGLLFEPSLPDGKLIGQRKGSGNFTVVVRGRSAHAGRAPDEGRNAIHTLASIISDAAALHNARPGLTINVGKVTGGEAVNRVPDLAIARLNTRVTTHDDQQFVEQRLQDIVNEANKCDGFAVLLQGAFYSPPKPLDAETRRLLELIADCGCALNLSIEWQSSGGVCDGNKLAAAGLTNVDTLGPRGGDIHSPREYLLIDSLTERAKLTALLLMRLAADDIQWQPERTLR